MTLGIFIDSSTNDRKSYCWDDKELQIFKDMIKKEKINCRMDEIFFLSFLRARKFDKEAALLLLKNYYSSRERYEDYFKDFNPLAIKEYLDMKIFGYIRQTDQYGRVIGIGKCSNWDPHKIHFKTIVKCVLMMHDMTLNEHVMQINGLVMILDANTLSWRHIFQLTPSTVYSAILLLFNSCQVRYEEIHVVNIQRLVHVFLAAFLPILPYKIKNIIHLHSSGMDSLHKFVDPKYLPVEYGGQLPPFDPTHCIEKMLEYQQFYEENEKYWNKPST